MSKEAIVERILSDARTEAEEIVRKAEQEAAETVAAARSRAEAERGETEAEVAERSRRIFEGKAATARLDGAKIALEEKRRVVDEIYARALEKLTLLGKRESLALIGALLEENAEEGDELLFAEGFAYADAAGKLPVVAQKKLRVSSERAKIGGGCLLRGEKCDKELSYAALLAQDREENQSVIAAEIFKNW